MPSCGTGAFEKSFLHDYGSALCRRRAEDDAQRHGGADAGMDDPCRGMPRLNWDGRDLGRDPMVASWRPSATTPGPRRSSSAADSTSPADHGEGREKLNAFDYFTQGREWPEDVVADGTSAAHGYDSLGHALEAAVLGASHDDPNARLSRDGDTAELMERVVERYGGDPALLRRQESLADSLGRMAAGYVDDINWSMNENDPTSMFAPRKGRRVGRSPAMRSSGWTLPVSSSAPWGSIRTPMRKSPRPSRSVRSACSKRRWAPTAR